MTEFNKLESFFDDLKKSDAPIETIKKIVLGSYDTKLCTGFLDDLLKIEEAHSSGKQKMDEYAFKNFKADLFNEVLNLIHNFHACRIKAEKHINQYIESKMK